MINNFVNKYDVIDLVKKGNKALRKVIDYLMLNQRKRVEKVYSVEEYCPTNWWDVPEVQARWNHMITGDDKRDYYEYLSDKYFKGRKNLRGLSLGCGTGHRELRWVQLLNFQSIDAIDLSEHSISIGKKEAINKGFGDIINYRVDDVNKMNLPQNYYDVIFTEQSLHHFTPLKKILTKIDSALKDDGYFIVNEFVGPTRFQWTEKQLNAINNLLAILPDKYKRRFDGEGYKSRIIRPSILRMALGDPSEAVESSDIVPFLRSEFNVLELKEYGGTILQMLFSEIAHNFRTDDPIIKRWVKLCFEVEDLLLKEKEIDSDFIIAVCKKGHS